MKNDACSQRNRAKEKEDVDVIKEEDLEKGIVLALLMMKRDIKIHKPQDTKEKVEAIKSMCKKPRPWGLIIRKRVDRVKLFLKMMA